jgi:hypothetical protein
MRKLVAEVENLESVMWPAKCSGCGQDISSETPHRYEVKVKRAVSAVFATGTPKTVSMKLCDKCSQRITGYKLLSNIGWGLVIIAIGGQILISEVFKQPMTPQALSGAAGCFGLGGILMLIRDDRQKKVPGVRCMRKLKNRWEFWFRNESFAHAFADMNSVLIGQDK